MRVEIYTDGACIGNPGPGGWGVILRYGDHLRELSGTDAATTNNRMELTAAIRGLEALKRPSEVDLFTDSRYLKQGITEWVPRWRNNGWRTASRKPVENRSLWEGLLAAAAPHRVDWHWLRAHAGHEWNERVDRLARAAALEIAAEK